MTVQTPAAGESVPSQQFAYDGRLGELFGIFFTNLLFSIITLGFYRFWAKTRMRRYIWSRVSLNGDAFEYTGTGGELFIGFLIVVGFFFVATILKGVIDLASEKTRLDKEIAKADADIKRVDAKLGNEKFVANAPEEIVEEEKEKREAALARRTRIIEALQRLQDVDA
jgi:hypothetical protein